MAARLHPHHSEERFDSLVQRIRDAAEGAGSAAKLGLIEGLSSMAGLLGDTPASVFEMLTQRPRAGGRPGGQGTPGFQGPDLSAYKPSAAIDEAATALDPRVGMPDEELSNTERIARHSGDVLGAMLPMMAGGAGLASRVARPARGVGRFLDTLAFEPYRRAPLAAGLLESTAAVGAGAGGEIGVQHGYPRLAGEAIGAVAGSATLPARLAARGITKTGRLFTPPEPPKTDPAKVTARMEATELDAARQVPIDDAFDDLTTEQARLAGKSKSLGPEGLTREAETRARAVLQNELDSAELRLSKSINDEVKNTMIRELRAGGITVDPTNTTRVFNLALEAIQSGRITGTQMQRAFAELEVTPEELGEAFHFSVSESAKTMNAMSQIAKAMKKAGLDIPKDVEGQLELAGEAGGSWQIGQIWRDANSVRRGALVSQLSTAMRNAETQAANVTLGTLENAMELGIQSLGHKLGVYEKPVQSPLTALVPLRDLFSRKAWRQGDMDKLLWGNFPKEYNQLFGHYMSDVDSIGVQTPVLKQAHGFVNMLNSFNRLQEYAFRRPVFRAALDRELGGELGTILAEGRGGEIDRKIIKKAMNSALEATWGRDYDRHSKYLMESIAGGAIHGINNTPLSLLMPFPRFMANSIQWQVEHSPYEVSRLLVSPEAWAQIGRGDVKPLIKSMTGTGMLYSGYKLRTADEDDVDSWRPPKGGGLWYQMVPPRSVADALKVDPNSPIDFRPFSPFSSYLFMGDIINRWDEGRPLPDFKSMVNGLAGLSVRAGAGMYVLDKFIEDFGELVSDESDTGWAEVGEFAGGFLGHSVSGPIGVTMKTMTDLMKSIDDSSARFGGDASQIRSFERDPLLGPIRERSPFDMIAGKLEEKGVIDEAPERNPNVYIPTQKDPVRMTAPGVGQLTGLRFINPLNRIHQEAHYHDLTQSSFVRSTGVPEVDRLNKMHFGRLAEESLVKTLDSPAYKKAGRAQQRIWLKDELDEIRPQAIELGEIDAENLVLEGKLAPERYQKYLDAKRTRDERALEKEQRRERGLQDAAALRSERLERRRIEQGGR